MPEEEASPLHWHKHKGEWYIKFDDLMDYLERTHATMSRNNDTAWTSFMRSLITRLRQERPGLVGRIMTVWDHGDG